MPSIDYYFDCGDLGELALSVDYDYEPAQRGTYDDPPLDGSVTVTAVSFKGRDVSWLLLDALNNSDAFGYYAADLAQSDYEADRADYLYQQMKDERYESNYSS